MAQMSFFLYIIEYMASKNAWNERDRGKWEIFYAVHIFFVQCTIFENVIKFNLRTQNAGGCFKPTSFTLVYMLLWLNQRRVNIVLRKISQ
jgi:hypothetical protein